MVIKSKIPETPGKTPSYCCTWILQNYFANLSGEATDHHLIVGNYLTEEAMSNFVHNTPFMSRARGDMILLHDLGWDLPVNFNYNIGESQFLNMLGSMTVAEDKFPSCTGSPAEKLKKLCQTVKDAGWKGTGIWVPSHAFEEPEGCTEEWLRNFYLERLEWSLDAGVSYWKVDYGIHSNDIRFREMITRLAEAAAPGLFIEHAKPSGFFNDFWGAGGVLSGSGRYAEWLGGDLLKQAKETALVSHVLRIYDVSDELSIPTTIDRVSELFIGLSKVKTNCIINCENEPYIGAVLGCAIGMMTHPYHKSIRPTFAEYKSQTAVEKNFIRAAMWQRIAPAVHAGENECHLEGGLLEDSWKFSPDSCFIGGTGCTSDTVVKQIAPAVFALNIKPPVVQNSKNGDAPFVLASSSENGNAAVAALPRASHMVGRYYPRAGVTLSLRNGQDVPLVGVFGLYDALRIEYNENQIPAKLFCQDLLSDEIHDITANCSVDAAMVTIPGKLMEDICGYGGGFEDLPGVVIWREL